MACRRMRGAAVPRAIAALAAGRSSAAAAVPAAPELRDLTVAVVPSPDPAGFFTVLHEGLFARQLAGTSRAAAERAMEALPPPPGLTVYTAAMISLDSYPAGPAGAVRIQRVTDVTRQLLRPPGLPSRRCFRGTRDGAALAFA